MNNGWLIGIIVWLWIVGGAVTIGAVIKDRDDQKMIPIEFVVGMFGWPFIITYGIFSPNKKLKNKSK